MEDRRITSTAIASTCRFWAVSAENARTKAELEYAKYKALLDASPRGVDAAFEKTAKELKKLPKPRKPKGGQE